MPQNGLIYFVSKPPNEITLHPFSEMGFKFYFQNIRLQWFNEDKDDFSYDWSVLKQERGVNKNWQDSKENLSVSPRQLG